MPRLHLRLVVEEEWLPKRDLNANRGPAPAEVAILRELLASLARRARGSS